MEKTKRQHYVPRMYLKRFGYKIKNMDKISVLKVNESQILEKQGVENFAISNYFYDVSKEELENIVKETFLLYPELKNSKSLEDDQFVEHALARKEAVINQLLDELEDDLGIIYKTENRARFVDFLHSMAYRTKSFRDKMENINQQTVKFLSDICDNMGFSEEQKMKEIAYHCTTGKETQLYQMLEISPILHTMEMLLKNYDWYEAYNNSELDFIISDNPFQTVWMGFNDICIPVSCTKAIVLRIKDKDAPLFSTDVPVGNVIQLSLKSVIAYNSIQLSTAQFYAFGTTKAISFMKSINELMTLMKKY